MNDVVRHARIVRRQRPTPHSAAPAPSSGWRTSYRAEAPPPAATARKTPPPRGPADTSRAASPSPANTPSTLTSKLVFAVILIELRQRIEVIAFALRLRAQPSAPAAPAPARVAASPHPDGPRSRATGSSPRPNTPSRTSGSAAIDIFELLLRLVVPEVVQQSDAAIERLLLRRRARSRKVHRAQLFGRLALRLRARLCPATTGENRCITSSGEQDAVNVTSCVTPGLAASL